MAPARLLLAALAAARYVEGAHEKYVIQAFDPAYTSAIDAKPPDGASTIVTRQRGGNARARNF